MNEIITNGFKIMVYDSIHAEMEVTFIIFSLREVFYVCAGIVTDTKQTTIYETQSPDHGSRRP